MSKCRLSIVENVGRISIRKLTQNKGNAILKCICEDRQSDIKTKKLFSDSNASDKIEAEYL